LLSVVLSSVIQLVIFPINYRFQMPFMIWVGLLLSPFALIIFAKRQNTVAIPQKVLYNTVNYQ